ncbi:MAG: citramalate synthase [Candidatus Gracilibacteria bacterium]|nr:citramalate synthase [Candidatus Gracilibacteria bacterium]MDD5178804.1 citramalate synthase [Candidatus Gracilibacteria bacterium]
MKYIYIYDTTLRDGSQSEGVNFTVNEKILITEKLNDFGFDFIEGGWPGSNPKDEEYFAKIKKIKLKSKVVAFSATHMKVKTAETDVLLQKVLAAETKYITVFGKVWDLHTRKILGVSDSEALDLISNTIKFLIKNKRKVIFDAEHCFDGWKSNPKFTLACLRAAEGAGAMNLTLCDTNGGSLPSELGKIISEIKKKIKTPLGIHTHNDSGVAVANSIIAVENGVNLIQGTINGIGERTGNANLNTIIADLQLKKGMKILPPAKLAQLTNLANYVYEIGNKRPKNDQPFVGKNAFTHKGGIHVSAVAKIPASYEHIDPKLVGNHTNITISELSGKSNVIAVAQRLGIKIQSDSPQIREILAQVKDLENQGFYYETAEASFALLILHSEKDYKKPFELQEYCVSNSSAGGVDATVEVKVKGKLRKFSASGNGPVNALDLALRQGIEEFFPQTKNVELTDYKVRILDTHSATAAKTRVLIESSNGKEDWKTVGCSENIIKASWQALSDSLEYAIWRSGKKVEK